MRHRRKSFPVKVLGALPLAAIALVGGLCGPAGAAFVNFESGHVRPLALSPDGSRLYAVNTPDNRLEIYNVSGAGLTLAAEVPVGLEPVAVAARTNTEVWVVNHLSDSVSIVDVNVASPALSRVRRTLLTCDEPRDIVFAGPGGNRAFVTTARRGQNCPTSVVPDNSIFIQAGQPRAVVQVYDATNLGSTLAGAPLTNVLLFSDTPRALARTPDGSRVYAAAFHSGNRTTSIIEGAVSGAGGVPPFPAGSTPGAPPTGLIVKFDGSIWRDERPTSNWNSLVPFSLPDRDVFIIDANANPPVLVSGTSSVVGVGTVIFNMAVRPNAAGQVYVANTDARNNVRFEPRILSDPPATRRGVQGHIAESRITVINGTTPTPQHLNAHVDRNCVPPGCISPQSERDASVAFPGDMTFSSNGQRLYLTAFGSGKIAILDAAALEAGSVNNPNTAPPGTRRLVTVGDGPSGVVLDETNNRLYVMNRISHDLSIVSNANNPATASETAIVPLRFDPSPPAARDGRIFLYDALNTSGHGDSACASCHIFGDFDSLAWDLGNPFGAVVTNFNPFRVGGGGPFHPLKGPMTTQTLRGMAGAGPMHWRGDRTGATGPAGPGQQALALNEDLAFKAFNPAFVGLLGRANQLSTAQMQAFTDFILTVVLPPNPIRALDNSATGDQATGLNLFTTVQTDAGVITCVFCHALPFGTDGFSSVEGETQEFKIPHQRNLYQKIGMFGVAGGASVGDQVRGFGFLHDGSVSTLQLFVSAPIFQNLNLTQERQIEQFLLAHETGFLAPIVGQQVSIDSTNFNTAAFVNRVNLLVARDDAGECEVVAKGDITNEARGAVYAGGGNFRTDRHSEALITTAALRALAGTAGQEITFTCVPPGEGTRMGVDRDEDGVFDRRELDCGTDPANPASFPATLTGPCPGGTTTTTIVTTTTSTIVTPTTTTTTTLPSGPTVNIRTTSLTMKDRTSPPNPSSRKLSFKSNTKTDPSANRIVIPARNSAGDPTVNGATLTVYNAAGSGEVVSVTLPIDGWTTMGNPDAPNGYRYKGSDPNGPVNRITLKPDSLKITAGKSNWGYTLDETSQGQIAVRLRAGSQNAWCASAPAKAPASSNDRIDKFVGEKPTLAPATCPSVP